MFFVFYRNFKFDDVHVKGAQDIARVARECGVEKLIHFSHLNAQPNPPSIYVKGGSGYLRSKVCHTEVMVAMLCFHMVSEDFSNGVKSGFFCLLIGVGTQLIIMFTD